MKFWSSCTNWKICEKSNLNEGKLIEEESRRNP